MIASLRGLLQSIGADSAVIDVNGVGYLVQVSARTASFLRDSQRALNVAVAAAPAPVFLFVETQVREDAITLFGFATEAERDWFRRLFAVQGVGGKVALSLLGALAPDELTRAITLEDRATVSRANGVGPRLATRIITELRGKELPSADSAVPLTTVTQGAAADALSALANLGFRPPEAARAVAAAQAEVGEAAAVGDLIRVALKKAAR
ncbi:Holliday junction branch migration protein RuvA [Sandaracinobacteroides saxicola]|uniref:Holliday junction branch migration complex subunit RuvA n=1 Tax=Sandaracinobacteroides saxicola TaxID=2759707 RepID=A0A7G5IFR8_9SPHN|nr:Holliday junction branch migration protein RuvA [Sandaracinobacteroides saxicola]QMW22210.1 Holliday junction branch migration protein RuvA [Sandaracinobacteroides saxicola]